MLADALKKPRKPKFSINVPSKSNNAGKDKYSIDQDTFTYNCSFSERHKLIEMDTLRFGDVNVSFCECTIDLSGVKSLSDDCSIGANCSFGELRIIVPKCYLVIAEHNTSFASIEINGTPDDDPAGEIHLDANVSFGEIEIQYI